MLAPEWEVGAFFVGVIALASFRGRGERSRMAGWRIVTMASLIKRKGSPWLIQYRQGKRWNNRSTGLTHTVSAETSKAREECAKDRLKELTISRVVVKAGGC